MSLKNGEKARAAVQKRKLANQRVTARAARAAAIEKAAAPAKKSK